MPFDVTIVFTGICSFVPRNAAPLAYCVVMPNGFRTPLCFPVPPRTGLDNVSKLEVHRSFIAFDADRLQGAANLANIAGLYYLNGRRVLLTPVAAQLPACVAGDLSGLASFDNLTPTPSLLAVSGAVLNPDPCLVGAQVIIENGTVTSPVTNLNWVFDNTLGASPPGKRKLNHEVRVTMPNIDTLTVRVNDLISNTRIQELVFDKAVTINIANLCTTDPLRWLDPPPRQEIKPDDDFRWHYEIVENRAALVAALNGLPCPIPRIDPSNPNGNGFNCFPKLFPALAFDPAIWH